MRERKRSWQLDFQERSAAQRASLRREEEPGSFFYAGDFRPRLQIVAFLGRDWKEPS
jgi:hypothetical protein